jgi:alpha-L-fucosidase
VSGKLEKRDQTIPLSTLQSQYVAKQFGVTLHFNNVTFTDQESPVTPPSIDAFNPSALNIDQWMTSIKAAKATYAELTAKHITGFCLWPTATTTYNITNCSWYDAHGGIDVVKLFVEKCAQYGLAASLYFCGKDYTFEANNPGYTQADYLAYDQAQLTELLTNYGKLLSIKLDATNTVFQPSNGYPWADGGAACTFIRSAQSRIVCAHNAQHNLPPSLAESNIAVYEGANLPGEFVQAGNTDPAECWDTIYDNGSPSSWFWKSSAPTMQTSSALIAKIALANSRGATYNLNVPPDNTGAIESRMVTVLNAIGAR